MANGSSRFLAVLVSLIIGFAVGWFLHIARVPKPTPAPSPAPGFHVIAVGPGAKDLSEDPAAVSQSKGHTVRWTALDPNLTLKITFEVKDFDSAANEEPPFEGSKGQPLVFNCKPSEFCKSGPINDKLNPNGTPKKEYNYKYGQTLLDSDGKVVDQADGWIIIKG